MRSLVLFALVSVAIAKPKPGGLISPWGAPSLSSFSLYHEPSVAVAQPVVHAAPIVQAAPVYHAPAVAVAKPAATSYASFQQVVHPVSVAQPVVHAAPVYHAAPVVAQPIVSHAPVISQPVVQTIAQPVVQKVVYGGSYGHGW